MATDRVVLELDGQRFTHWTRAQITRDLGDIAGSFSLECADVERLRRALPWNPVPTPWPKLLAAGMAARLLIDDEPVLVGWVDEVQVRYTATTATVLVQGRDVTGDLVDCAAAPRGPAEYRNRTLTQIAEALCAPFGITVRADVDVGAPLPVFSLDVGETVLSALEKAARQRAILIVSDGVGGLRLTRGGAGEDPAPATIRFGQNVLSATATLSWQNRFSQVFVKGQSQAAGIALDATAAPLSAATPPAAAPATAASPQAGETRRAREGLTLKGEATDPEITRWRPTVLQTRTQSGGATAQEQADWAVRVARSRGRSVEYAVPDWRAGPDRRLWKPNQIALVDDQYTDLLEEMLVAGLSYDYGPDGAETRLRVVGRHALDLLPEGGEQPRQRRQAARLDGTAVPLEAR